MRLKQYQSESLGVLRRFFEQARIAGPQTAYETLTTEPELAFRLGRHAGTYVSLQALPTVPYVCLRLPTGGGKTLLAAHAVAVARDAWIERDFPVVLWLTPSNTIRVQTLDALKSSVHPYRRALDEAFAGRVRLFDIADFAHLRPQDLADYCCVVVGTIQTLRVSNTEGRKVYAHHEALEPHFSPLKTSEGLELHAKGAVKFSFANLLHRHRPLLIVDEAHNAVTGLTREMQARINPTAIIEFSATPRTKSNILYSVTAHELKREQMIKLPIILSEHPTWQSAVNGAIAARADLAATAKDDADYLRPLVLFQAQPRGQEVTVDALRRHLIEVERVPEHRIAVATGAQRELDGINLFDPQCPIEYVVTIEALKEGWDCSFAYIFCSVSRIRSAVDVEQLLGRVLRMPYAARRRAADLNRAYAFLSEPSFGAAARALVDKLIAMGFEEEEAHDNIEPAQRDFDGGDPTGRFETEESRPPKFIHTISGHPATLSALKQSKIHGLNVREIGNRIEISLTRQVDTRLERLLYAAVPELEHEHLAGAIATYRANVRSDLSPAKRGDELRVPRLMTMLQGELAYADTDVLMEAHDWSLLDHAARLDANEFSVRETARSFEIDVDGSRISYQFAGEHEQLALDVAVEGWTAEALVLWLDLQVRQPDIAQSDLIRWLSELVRHLVSARDLPMTALMRCKFVLARRVREKIDGLRRSERERAYQGGLFSPSAKPAVSFEHAFVFHDDMYRDEPPYRGHWRPTKHYFGRHFVPAFDGANDGEEVQCAQALDGLTAVRFWVRNVARHPSSFWLPTATDRFYPDFIAKLDDERLLVVEYKGAHLTESSDTAEKRAIGELWQRNSRGAGVFIVVEKNVDGRDMHQQLQGAIVTNPR